MKTVNLNDLTSHEQKLISAAEGALQNAYNPYGSKSLVAAAVLTTTGEIITGACFGNASSTVNICAERSAVITANSLGHRNISMLAITYKSDHPDEPLTPCGVCLQFLLEIPKITGQDLIILSVNPDKSIIYKTSLSKLLPYPYSRRK